MGNTNSVPSGQLENLNVAELSELAKKCDLHQSVVKGVLEYDIDGALAVELTKDEIKKYPPRLRAAIKKLQKEACEDSKMSASASAENESESTARPTDATDDASARADAQRLLEAEGNALWTNVQHIGTGGSGSVVFKAFDKYM